MFWLFLTNSIDFGNEPYKFNELFSNLTENTIENWKVKEAVAKNMSEGEFGIIKIGEDRRTKEQLRNENGSDLSLKLEAGIYGICQIVKDEKNRLSYYDEINECYYVNIKIIDNFMIENRYISKDKSQEILGDKYMSMYSRDITQEQFEKILIEAFYKKNIK